MYFNVEIYHSKLKKEIIYGQCHIIKLIIALIFLGWKPLSGFIDMIPNIDSTDNSTLVWIAKGGPKVIGHHGPTIQVVRYNRITSN